MTHYINMTHWGWFARYEISINIYNIKNKKIGMVIAI